jgi:mRNA interferase MazF
MLRGDLYLVKYPGDRDPKKFRVYCVVSRQAVINSRHSSVICAPVYSSCHGLSTQVLIGIDQGIKHDSCIHCDELVSLPKSVLTNYIGSLSVTKIKELNKALKAALDTE